MKEANPILVERYRGNTLETRHRGSAAVIDSSGKVLASWGNIDEPSFLRSATKPMQGIPLIISGVAEKLNLTKAEISLGCASHSAEEIHESCVLNWLKKADIDVSLMECGPPEPSCPNNKILKSRGIKRALPIHNNCSGKHANFMSVAKHMGYEIKGYSNPEHPVQQMVRDVIKEIAQIDIDNVDMAIEGCGVPAYAFTRREAAYAYARFADANNTLSKDIAKAANIIFDSMVSEPYMYGGVGEFDTLVTQELKNIVTKQGSQGSQIAIIPSLKIGVALKMDDGIVLTKEVAMGAILNALGLVSEKNYENLKNKFEPQILNSENKVVGKTVISQEFKLGLDALKEKVKYMFSKNVA